MTTPSGTIALSDVNTELGYSSTATITMNDTAVRTLAGVSSGTISMDNLRGKSNRVSISYTFATSTQYASINVSTIGGYVTGKSDITINVNSGVYLWSGSTGSYGLNINGGSSGDTLVVNNSGYVMGMGGDPGGGMAQSGYVSTVYPQGGAGHNGNAGGPAMNISGFGSASINNVGYIGGGGGGGATMPTTTSLFGGYSGGGGGAGGAQGNGGVVDAYNNYSRRGGNGGGIGQKGQDAQFGRDAYGNAQHLGGGGGGGRIFPGVRRTDGQNLFGYGGEAGGCGGGGYGSTKFPGGQAGYGGAAGEAGGTAVTQASGWNARTAASGGGGGWGASGGGLQTGSSYSQRSGGAGGKAINTNGASITWITGSTRAYGAVN